MDDATNILIIILTITLICFLLSAICLVIMLIRVSKQVNSIMNDVEATTHKITKTIDNVIKVSSPVFIAKFIKNWFTPKKKKGSQNDQK